MDGVRDISPSCGPGEALADWGSVDQPTLHLSLPVVELDDVQGFYVDTLGCPLGRRGDGWIDVWFFGLQLTLHERPDEVLPRDRQGVRHFGVVLEKEPYEGLVSRLRVRSVEWVHDPSTFDVTDATGKLSVKFADPAGNVIEVKHYPDRSQYDRAAVIGAVEGSLEADRTTASDPSA